MGRSSAPGGEAPRTPPNHTPEGHRPAPYRSPCWRGAVERSGGGGPPDPPEPHPRRPPPAAPGSGHPPSIVCPPSPSPDPGSSWRAWGRPALRGERPPGPPHVPPPARLIRASDAPAPWNVARERPEGLKHHCPGAEYRARAVVQSGFVRPRPLGAFFLSYQGLLNCHIGFSPSSEERGGSAWGRFIFFPGGKVGFFTNPKVLNNPPGEYSPTRSGPPGRILDAEFWIISARSTAPRHSARRIAPPPRGDGLRSRRVSPPSPHLEHPATQRSASRRAPALFRGWWPERAGTPCRGAPRGDFGATPAANEFPPPRGSGDYPSGLRDR